MCIQPTNTHSTPLANPIEARNDRVSLDKSNCYSNLTIIQVRVRVYEHRPPMTLNSFITATLMPEKGGKK